MSAQPTNAEQPRRHPDLLGSEHPEVRLPEEVATRITADDAGADLGSLEAMCAAVPTDSGAWAALALRLLDMNRAVEAYACARTGYHRGLDALRSNGWRGAGAVPWSHTPNQGVLRAIGALARTAAAIGEDEEVTRCLNLLVDCDRDSIDALHLGDLQGA